LERLCLRERHSTSVVNRVRLRKDPKLRLRDIGDARTSWTSLGSVQDGRAAPSEHDACFDDVRGRRSRVMSFGTGWLACAITIRTSDFRCAAQCRLGPTPWPGANTLAFSPDAGELSSALAAVTQEQLATRL